MIAQVLVKADGQTGEVKIVRSSSELTMPSTSLPVLSMYGRKGLLRYRASEIEKFISELERLSTSGRGYNRTTPPIAAPKRENYGKEVVPKGLDSAQR